jgi:hypothetical protein
VTPGELDALCHRLRTTGQPDLSELDLGAAADAIERLRADVTDAEHDLRRERERAAALDFGRQAMEGLVEQTRERADEAEARVAELEQGERGTYWGG